MPEMTEEQARELQEKLKQMSPEELKEFQKKQCIFCHIISGKVQARKIYEDDKVMAVLDINPANGVFFVGGTDPLSSDSSTLGEISRNDILGKVVWHIKKPSQGINRTS